MAMEQIVAELVDDPGNLQSFIEQFPVFAAAPGGIEKLRELILQLGVNGQLTAQSGKSDINILDEVQRDRNQLVLDKAIRKQKELSKIERDNWALPRGWELVRLGDLSPNYTDNIVDGPFGSRLKASEYQDDGTPIIRIQNIDRNLFKFKSIKFIDPKKAAELSRHSFVSGDIVINKLGEPVGKACIVPEQLDYGIIVADIVRIRIESDVICKQFLVHVLNSPSISTQLNGSAKGITRQRVNLGHVREIVLPYPPMEEQKRIVAKVDELMALCDQLEAQQQQQANTVLRANTAAINALLNLDSQPTTSSAEAPAGSPVTSEFNSFENNWQRIAQHFNILYGCTLPMPPGEGRQKKHLMGLECVKQAKGLVRSLACQGKLTMQRASNNATDLINLAAKLRLEVHQNSEGQLAKELEGIARKLKKQNAIQSDEALPQNWVWASLIEISQLVVDCHNKTAPYTEDGIHLIRTTNIRHGKMDVDSSKKVSKETYEYWSRRCPPKPRDVFFTREAPMGEAAMVPAGEKVCLGQRTMLIRLFEECLLPEYLLIAIYDPSFQYRMGHSSLGATVQHLRVGDVENMLIPLPPLEEQKRIVAKVDELMALCDQLEQQLTQAYGDAEKLMETTVKALVT